MTLTLKILLNRFKYFTKSIHVFGGGEGGRAVKYSIYARKYLHGRDGNNLKKKHDL